MRRLSRVIAALILSLAVLALVAGLLPLAAQEPAGQTLWAESSCKSCHGASGEGGWGMPLAGSQKTADEWIAQVRSPRNRMPAYSESQVGDQTIGDIHDYLASLEPPASFTPSSADLPADAPRGQQLIVEKKCVACHATTGPVGGFKSREETPTAEAVIAQLRTPRNRMPMFRAEQVSDEDAAEIAAFLAAQISPASLPTTGGSARPAIWAVALLLLAGGLWLSRIAFRMLGSRP